MEEEKIKSAIFLFLGIGISSVGLSIAISKSAENTVLREENARLRKEVKITNYRLGRLMTKKIYRK